MFADLDPTEFWEQSSYADTTYVDDPLTAEKVALVEGALKVRLPAAYVELMKVQNGGTPSRTNHRTAEPTSWADDHVAITGIFSIGNAKPCSLCGECGSQFWIDEWGYPPIGVYFADCPSAGHDLLALDYRECGPEGEPAVVHVDQESDYAITFVAPDFETFIRGLEQAEPVDVEPHDPPPVVVLPAPSDAPVREDARGTRVIAPVRGDGRVMRVIALVLALGGAALLAFGWWGTHTAAARFGDGFVPIGTGALGGMLIIAGAIVDIVAERRHRKATR